MCSLSDLTFPIVNSYINYLLSVLRSQKPYHSRPEQLHLVSSTHFYITTIIDLQIYLCSNTFDLEINFYQKPCKVTNSFLTSLVNEIDLSEYERKVNLDTLKQVAHCHFLLSYSLQLCISYIFTLFIVHITSHTYFILNNTRTSEKTL